MKYEAVFGDYKFSSPACEIAMQSSFGEIIEMSFTKPLVIPEGWGVIAMRRIIQEPKRWTVEDQKAGKLPEVGSKLIYTKSRDAFEFVGVVAGSMRWACKDFRDGFLYFFEQSEMSPIQSPEEKAARLRKEWCIKALSSCSILSGMQKYELKRLGGYIEDIYDAILSGDLPVPVKDGE